EYGEEDRVTTVTAKPAAPAAEKERHRLTALEGVAALSLDALLAVAYGPEGGCASGSPTGSRIMTAEPGSWWLVLLGGLAGQAARVAEADRGRAALLATVSHDLRTPLAAAKAAVSALRAGDARLTTDDRADLLAAAEESLDRLAHLAASLLDMSRLQAGARAVFPRPA